MHSQLVAREAFSNFVSSGMLSMERGEFAAAMHLFDLATAVDPQDMSPYVLRAKCHMLADSPAIQKALAEADKVVKIKPNDATGYMIAWNTLCKTKFCEAAFRLIRVAMIKVSAQDPQRRYIEEIYGKFIRKIQGSAIGGNNSKKLKLHKNDAAAIAKPSTKNLGMFGQYQLPNELVHTIFAYLSFEYLGRGQRVCKAWLNYIQKDRMLWTKVNLCGPNINNSVMAVVANRARSQLRSFALKATKVSNAGIKKIIATRPNQLLDIRLERCAHIDHSAITDICKVFGKTLTRLSLIMQNLTDQCLDIIFTRCNQLIRLDVSGNSKITDAGFKSWLASSPLQSLNAVSCSSFSLSGSFWSTEYPNLIELDMSSTRFNLLSFKNLTAFPMLQILWLVNVDLHPIDTQLTLPTIAKEVTRKTLSKLTHFAMTHRALLDDESLQSIALANPNLAHIVLTYSSSLTDVGLSCLQYCKELKSLTVTGVTKLTDLSLKLVLSNCKKLERVNINDLPKVTDATLETIVEEGENLIHLDVSNCPEITGYGILKLHKKAGCPLKHLIMNCLATVSNDTIRSFQKKGIYVEGNLQPVKIKVPGYR